MLLACLPAHSTPIDSSANGEIGTIPDVYPIRDDVDESGTNLHAASNGSDESPDIGESRGHQIPVVDPNCLADLLGGDANEVVVNGGVLVDIDWARDDVNTYGDLVSFIQPNNEGRAG
jgi:hypothetical protein